MKPNTRIIWKADKKLSKKGLIGYLYLETRIRGKRQLLGINLPAIEKKYWLTKKFRVSDMFPTTENWTAEKVNQRIEVKLRESSLAHHDFRYLPDEKKSFIEFFEQQIDLTINQGTKMKYENIKALLIEYLKDEMKKDSVDLKFQEITTEFIYSFFNYLRLTRKNTHNTSMFKMKCFHAMVNRAISQNIYYYPKSPFDNFKYEFQDTMVKELLSLEELDRLFNTNLYEVYRSKHKFGQVIPLATLQDARYRHSVSLNDYRNFWIFQLFSQGLRISDLLTLRWNDFKTDENKKGDDIEIRVIKRMVKTKAFVTIFLNDKLVDILTPYVFKFCKNSPEVHNTDWYKRLIDITSEVPKLEEKDHYGKKLMAAYPNPSLKQISQSYKNEYIQKLNFRRRVIVKNAIFHLASKFKTSFVFGLLNDNDYKDINDDNDFGTMTQLQYRRLSGARAYYNRLLKCIATQVEIKKNLTTHLARHSYTSLMIELGEEINLFDVMSSLGHKHITTTQTYLQKFTNKKLDNLNRVLSEKLDSKWSFGIEGGFNPIQKPLE